MPIWLETWLICLFRHLRRLPYNLVSCWASRLRYPWTCSLGRIISGSCFRCWLRMLWCLHWKLFPRTVPLIPQTTPTGSRIITIYNQNPNSEQLQQNLRWFFSNPPLNDNNLLLQSTANVRIEGSGEEEENAGDETVTTPPALRKTSLLDTLRPRSKSDAYASYKQRKSSFLTQLKMKKNKNVSLISLLEYLTKCRTFNPGNQLESKTPESPPWHQQWYCEQQYQTRWRRL